MESSILNVRVDSDDKKKFENFCSSVGMNVSTAVNMFIKSVLRENKLPFEITNKNNNDIIYEKLLEAELEMSKTDKRYTADEVLESLNKIINEK